MKKFIYGKYDTDTFFVERTNCFHDLCVYLGAYLIYIERKSQFESFDKFIATYSLTYLDSNRKYWAFVNKAQVFIRDNINSKNDNNKKKIPFMSRKQIKRLGHNGNFVPAFPRQGYLIEKELFDCILYDEKYEEIKEFFLNNVFSKWENNIETLEYYYNPTKEHIINTAINFCGFQYEVLRKHENVMKTFFSHEAYIKIQQDLEDKKNEGNNS